jgi:hypothetical protein
MPYLFLIPIVGTICLFSFVAIAVWTDNRRKEREAYYKSETLKKIAETQGSGGGSAIELLREEERIAARRRIEGLKIGGLITIAVGVGILVSLRMVPDIAEEGLHYVGLIPLFIGVALAVYAYFLAPKQ